MDGRLGVLQKASVNTKADDNKQEYDFFASKADNDVFNSDNSLKSLGESFRPMRSREQQNADRREDVNEAKFPTDSKLAGSDFAANLEQYKHSFPRKYKEHVVSHAKKYGITETCKKFKITKKNIERWQQKGFERKKGAGRKTTNPAMEQDMLIWVQEYIYRDKKLPKRKFIISQAKNFVSDNFKASKGWCDKFLKRNRLRFSKLLDEVKETN